MYRINYFYGCRLDIIQSEILKNWKLKEGRFCTYMEDTYNFVQHSNELLFDDGIELSVFGINEYDRMHMYIKSSLIKVDLEDGIATAKAMSRYLVYDEMVMRSFRAKLEQAATKLESQEKLEIGWITYSDYDDEI